MLLIIFEEKKKKKRDLKDFQLFHLAHDKPVIFQAELSGKPQDSLIMQFISSNALSQGFC